MIYSRAMTCVQHAIRSMLSWIEEVLNASASGRPCRQPMFACLAAARQMSSACCAVERLRFCVYASTAPRDVIHPQATPPPTWHFRRRHMRCCTFPWRLRCPVSHGTQPAAYRARRVADSVDAHAASRDTSAASYAPLNACAARSSAPARARRDMLVCRAREETRALSRAVAVYV